jgi:serine/threonine-protein kinase RsbW
MQMVGSSQCEVISIPGTHRAGPFFELRQSVPSRVDAISPAVEQLMLFITTFRMNDDSETEIDVALSEALANAIVHGNKNDARKSVDVLCRCGSDGELLITVRDDGDGFDPNAVPDPTAMENLLSDHGRGLLLIRTLMDNVHFEEGGTVLQMRKRPPQLEERSI